MTKIALSIVLIISVTLVPAITYEQVVPDSLPVSGVIKHLTVSQIPRIGIYQPEIRQGIIFQYATDDLWKYLRLGLGYLESPRPLDLPEAVPPSYIHPDGQGFGGYGFSPAAYADVQRLYPFFKQCPWEDILKSQRLYELANQAFADWLLKNMQSDAGTNRDFTGIFNNLHQAWNLGLSGFKQGRRVVSSRKRRATEFLKKQLL